MKMKDNFKKEQNQFLYERLKKTKKMGRSRTMNNQFLYEQSKKNEQNEKSRTRLQTRINIGLGYTCVTR